MERPKQRWRFELGRVPRECKIFYNDEQWQNVVSLKIEAGNGRMTLLTLELLPDEVVVEMVDPDIDGDGDDGLFGAR